MFTSTGKLIYDPYARIKQAPYWSILKTDEEIIRYYKAMIAQLYDVSFEKTVWGSHISVIRGTAPPNKSQWKKYQNETISFQYTNRVYRAHSFFCIDAYSPRLEEIRVELGLSPTPKAGFHITIGRLNLQYFKNKQEKLNLFSTQSNLKLQHNTSLYPLFNV